MKSNKLFCHRGQPDGLATDEDTLPRPPVLSLRQALREGLTPSGWSLLELLRLPEREAPPAELLWRVFALGYSARLG